MGCLFSKRSAKSRAAGERGEAASAGRDGGGGHNGDNDNNRPKQYSWDKRDKVDLQRYVVSGVRGGAVVGRAPGSLAGQPLAVRGCSDCALFALDRSASVTVDECQRCSLVLGPVRGSVFLRDCEDCRILVACQQFRTRDCRGLEIFLCCSTQPVIESSSSLKFACYQCYYPELAAQFRDAELSIFNNNWSSIHDFTPVPGERNFSLVPHGTNVAERFPLPAAAAAAAANSGADAGAGAGAAAAADAGADAGAGAGAAGDAAGGRGDAEEQRGKSVGGAGGGADGVGGADAPGAVAGEAGDWAAEQWAGVMRVRLSLEAGRSLVPVTRGGGRGLPGEEAVLAVIFSDAYSTANARRIIDELAKQALVLVQSKEVSMKSDDAQRVFRTRAADYSALTLKGPVIGLEFNGERAVEKTRTTVESLLHGTPVFVSASAEVAAEDIDAFYNFADLQMSG